MGMGGDLAAQWLKDFVGLHPGAARHQARRRSVRARRRGCAPGQDTAAALGTTLSDTDVSVVLHRHVDDSTVPPASSIDMAETVVDARRQEHVRRDHPDRPVRHLRRLPRLQAADLRGDAAASTRKMSQTGAMGVVRLPDRVHGRRPPLAPRPRKVINVPGCPTNPWWFVLTVVLFMADFAQNGASASSSLASHAADASAVDSSGRLKAVYPIPVHSACCPRYHVLHQGHLRAEARRPGLPAEARLQGYRAPTRCAASTAGTTSSRENAGTPRPTRQPERRLRRSLHDGRSSLHGLHREGLSGQLRALREALETPKGGQLRWLMFGLMLAQPASSTKSTRSRASRVTSASRSLSTAAA